ncbi:MAG: hypothetical protein ACYCSF_09580, partial [Acidimicrobiales bacterium]
SKHCVAPTYSPDLQHHQHERAGHALARAPGRVKSGTDPLNSGLSAGRSVEVIDRPTPLQRQILDAFGVEVTGWARARIS